MEFIEVDSGTELPETRNRNAYKSVVPDLCNKSLLTIFELSYKGDKKDIRDYVWENGINLKADGPSLSDFYELKQDEYDVTLLKALLENDEVCDLGVFVEVFEDEKGRSVRGPESRKEYNFWRKNLHGYALEVPSLEFYVKEVVNLRNEAYHNQRKDMTEDIFFKKLKVVECTLNQMIERMKLRYHSDRQCEIIKQFEEIFKNTKCSVSIWRDMTPKIETEVFDRVSKSILEDHEIDIRLPTIENDCYLCVSPSKVYLNIKGEGFNRQITSSEIINVLRNSKYSPHRTMVLEGQLGIGKTTSLYRIKEEHQSLKRRMKFRSVVDDEEKIFSWFEGLDDFEVLVYHPLRNNKYKSLKDLIHFKFGAITRDLVSHEYQLQTTLLKRPSILLLDALDESSSASEKLVRDVWESMNHYPELYTIFTTRPSQNNALSICAGKEYENFCYHVTGLDPNEFFENAGKLIDEVHGKRKGRKKDLENRKQEALKALMQLRMKFPPIAKNPLILTISVLLVLDPHVQSLENIQSLTQLFSALINSFIRKLCDSKLVEEPILENYLDFLYDVSLDRLQCNNFVFGRPITEKLRSKIRSLGITHEYLIEKILQSFLTKKEEDVYQHFHAAIQTYFAAKALLKNLYRDDYGSEEFRDQISVIQAEHRNSVITLLVGLLHGHENQNVFDKIISVFSDPFPGSSADENDCTLLLDVLQESIFVSSGNPNNFLEKVIDKLPDSIFIQEDYFEVLDYIFNREMRKYWPKKIHISIKSDLFKKETLHSILIELNKRNSFVDLDVNKLTNIYERMSQSKITLFENLPRFLPRLKVRLNAYQSARYFEAMNLELPELLQLHMLSIFLEDGCSQPDTRKPGLNYNGRILMLVNENRLTNEHNLEETAKATSWLLGSHRSMCNGIAFTKCKHLSAESCMTLMEKLYESGVKALWVCVFTCLRKEEIKQLQIKALTFGLGFFFLFVLKIMVSF